jgi:hypothetical protein
MTSPSTLVNVCGLGVDLARAHTISSSTKSIGAKKYYGAYFGQHATPHTIENAERHGTRETLTGEDLRAGCISTGVGVYYRLKRHALQVCSGRS